MRNHTAARAQRESMRQKARRPAGAAEPYDPALERYLRLESTAAGGHARDEDAHPTHDRPHLTDQPHGVRAGGPLSHVCVEINGRDVEVTEDAVGVVELHLR